MKMYQVSAIDRTLKWFFILSSAYCLYLFIDTFDKGEFNFELLLNCLIQIIAAVYFLKKTNLAWITENEIFLLLTITGLAITKAVFLYLNGSSYIIPLIFSVLLLLPCFVSYKRYMRDSKT